MHAHIVIQSIAATFIVKKHVIMSSKQLILDLLKQKSNIFNKTYQTFQQKVKCIVNEMMKSDCSDQENKAMYRCNDRINTLFSDYSFAINRLEIEYMTKCEICLHAIHLRSLPLTETSVKKLKVQTDIKEKTNSWKQKHQKEKPNESVDGNNDMQSLLELATPYKPHKCKLCHKTFQKKAHLQDHHTIAHTKGKAHQCDQCDKTFKLRRFLYNHIRQVHNGYPYECTDCNRRFQRSAELKRHQASS
eukprot:431800_1